MWGSIGFTGLRIYIYIYIYRIIIKKNYAHAWMCWPYSRSRACAWLIEAKYALETCNVHA